MPILGRSIVRTSVLLNQQTKTTRTILWVGASGKTYQYYIYPIDHPMADVPGNYIWARETEPGRFRALYAGEAQQLGQRINRSHEKYACVAKHGATHITARRNDGGRDARLTEEADLRRSYRPVCNDQ